MQQTSTDSHCLRDVGHSELVVADILVNQLVDLQDKLFVDVIERLTVEQADFIRRLCGMANYLNQLAHRANEEGFHAVAPFHKIIISKIDEILNLIRR